MDKICKNCKYWGKYKESACDKEGSLAMVREESFSVEASAADDTDLEAYLITGPNFGCVQFEPYK